MSPKLRKRYKILLFLLIAVALIVTSVLLNRKFDLASKNKEAFVKNAEWVISEKENKVSALLDQIVYELPVLDDSLYFAGSKSANLKEQDISLLIFKNDTICFWSDIHFPGKSVYDASVYDSSMLKTGNGWYRVLRREAADYKILGLILVKSEYRYENDYLQNCFQRDFNIPSVVQIFRERGDYPVFSREGKYLFSLFFKKKIPLNDQQSVLLFLIYLTGFLFFIAVIFNMHKHLGAYYKNAWLFVPAFVIDLFILRFLLFHFRIPTELYQTNLFGPLYYASSALLPSFGDLLTNSILIIIAAWAIYKHFDFRKIAISKLHPYLRLFICSVVIIALAQLFYMVLRLLHGMVIDSVIPYTPDNIFNLTLYSVFGFLIMAGLILSFVLVSLRLLNIIYRMSERSSGYLVSLFFALAVLVLVLVLMDQSWLQLAAFAIYIFGMWLFRERAGKNFLFTRLAFGLIFFSLLCTYQLNHCNDFKEKEKRKSLAQKLSASQDPIAEYLFEDIQDEIVADSILKDQIQLYPVNEQLTKDYIRNTYFRGFWDKYQLQITLCNNYDSLFIKPEMVNRSCHDYFKSVIDDFGKKTTSTNLFVLNYGTGGNSYISKFEFNIDSIRSVCAYIELYSKFIPKGLGYPELLIDKKIFLNTDLSNYSYARYRNGELVDAYGKYYYSIIQDPRETLTEDLGFFDRNDYNHLYYRIDDNANLVISSKSNGILETIAPFSLLFLFYSLFMLLFFGITAFPYRKGSIRLNFKNRLQLSMIAMILISFVLIGVSMYYYIRNLNENKNLENLSEKAISILIETQAKLADFDTLTPDMEAYASNWLVKFSNVFFSDINLFDLNGDLISSSRPQIFNEGLVADRMDPVAYNELVYNKKTIYIHKETIGELDYYSAYLPFYNNQNKLTAYLNLPYFARENELKQELSTFMMTFINIYVFLIAIAIIIALIIAGRMTRPLKEIRDKIGKVKLGGKNEKINWPRQMDEIGEMVKEYNRMIDELSLSAELLAKSERESAWREMAKQVAHEIKNPLTPMKLSVQYLEKAWNDKAPDWEDKLKKFTQTLIEQIDSLSAIASAFSDFAKMPKSEMEKMNLNKLIATTVATFSGNNTKIELHDRQEDHFDVLADRRQIIRVLNNLITNAIQALEGRKDGRVDIELRGDEDMVRVIISDNGPGIPEDQKLKIFMPNFSTKSEGMGLGLAMVKSIVEGHGGSIWFRSHEGEGVTFVFEIPVYKE